MRTTRAVLPTPAPIITSARLLMRPLKRNDIDDFHAIRTQIEVMKWTSTGKTDIDKNFTSRWMERFMPPNDSETYNLAIEELLNPGRVIGVVGMPVAEPPEIGYMVHDEMWGKGYATEAVDAWLYSYWRLPRKVVQVEEQEEEEEEEMPRLDRDVDFDGITKEVLRAVIETSNISSRKVLEKCGFKYFGSEKERDSQEGSSGFVWLDYFFLERPDNSQSTS